MSFEPLVQNAITSISRAVVVNGKSGRVGTALLMKDGSIITGFNIESRGFPILHAEIVAVITAIKMGYSSNDYVALAIACNFPGDYPACACCRQFLWEHTNPDLTIISYDLNAKEGKAYKLGELYPMPFPTVETFKKDDVQSVEQVVNDDKQEENKGVASGVVKDEVSENV